MCMRESCLTEGFPYNLSLTSCFLYEYVLVCTTSIGCTSMYFSISQLNVIIVSLEFLSDPLFDIPKKKKIVPH